MERGLRMLKYNKVSKANDLNLRAYKLNRTEQLLVLSVISMIQPDDEDFKTYRLSIKDFLNLLEIEDQSKYVELPKLTKGLMSKVIEIRKPHSLLQVTWFSSAEHKQGEGIIEVEFSPKLKPYLLNLKDNFVTYGLDQVSKLSSKYSIRIYELLKGNEFKSQKFVEFNLNDFRELIGLDDTIYPRYSNFKPKVLLKAEEEINRETDLTIRFDEIKTGRKVTKLKFYITSKNTPKKAHSDFSNTSEDRNETDGENRLESKYEPIRAIIEEPITNFEIKKLYDAAKGDIEKISLVYKYYKKVSQVKVISNMMGYLLSLLKNGYNKPIESKVTPIKKDFDEREYDYDELERKLLGWDKP